MTTIEVKKDARVEVCSMEQLRTDGFKVVPVEGHTVLYCWNRRKCTLWTTAVLIWGFLSTGARWETGF